MSRFKGEYPPDWDAIQLKVKQRANWQCERCFRVNDSEHGYTLTVHHLDNDKSNCEDWNLAALCQRCHLHIQGKVEMSQIWMFEHTGWMKPHVEGYLNSLKIQQQINLEW
jgi:5-methylcytosine-specific restriction endonuclease McrA